MIGVKRPPKVLVSQPPRPATSSIRFRGEDWDLVEKLQKKTGIGSVADLVRMALRALAVKEGVK